MNKLKTIALLALFLVCAVGVSSAQTKTPEVSPDQVKLDAIQTEQQIAIQYEAQKQANVLVDAEALQVEKLKQAAIADGYYFPIPGFVYTGVKAVDAPNYSNAKSKWIANDRAGYDAALAAWQLANASNVVDGSLNQNNN